MEDNDFRWTGERSLEARNLDLWNAFPFIPTRLPVPEISSRKKVIFNRLHQTRLKLRKLWTAVTRKITTSGGRVNDRRKRGIFPFKTLFGLSRYDFRLPRYRRVKRSVIFNRFYPSFLSLARLTDLSQTEGKRRFVEQSRYIRFLEDRKHAFPGKKSGSLGRGPIRNLRYSEDTSSVCLYLDDRLR